MAEDYRVIDPRDWRVQLIFVVVIAALAVLVWVIGETVQRHVAELQTVAASNPEAAARRAAAALRTLLAVLLAGNVAVAAYLAWLGVRVVSSDRLPPPGSWIIKGRKVYTGRYAKRIGRLFIALAVLIVAVSLAILWIGWRFTAL